MATQFAAWLEIVNIFNPEILRIKMDSSPIIENVFTLMSFLFMSTRTTYFLMQNTH